MFGSNRKSLFPQPQSSAQRPPNIHTPMSRHPPSHSSYSTARSLKNDPNSEKRYSLAMTGIPSAISQRNSSFFKSISNQNMVKDSRNLNDRHVQQAMQRKVFQYLVDANYPQVSEKLVKSPTKGEFARMFEFIFQHLAPNYRLRKIEDEMPRLFRVLGYPVQLKPSTMQTIGAAHTMPHLLGAITWLIDLIQMAEEISPQELLLANEDGDGQRRTLAYGYTVRCYKKYCSNPSLGFNMDNYKDENNVLLQLTEEKEDLTQQEAELDAQAAILIDEIAELCKDKGELDKLQADTKTLEEDAQRLNLFRGEQQEKLNAEKKRKDENEEKVQKFSESIADLRTELSQKEKQLATQTMSGEEARALRIHREEIKARIDRASKERYEVEVENKGILSINFKEASQLRERYQALIRDFEETSRTINGMDDSFFTVLEQHSPNEPQFLVFAAEIEEKLNQLLDKVNSLIKNKEDDLVKIDQDTAELKQKKAVLIESLKKVQRQLSKLSHNFSLKRADWENERQKVALDTDVAQNELDSLHALRKGKLFAHEQLAEVRKELQSRQIECEEAMKRIVNEVAVKFATLVGQWDHLKRCQDQMREDENLLRETLNKIADESD